MPGGGQLERRNAKAVEKRASGFNAASLVQPSTVIAIYLLWRSSLGDVISILTEDVAMNFLVLAKSWKSETLNR